MPYDFDMPVDRHNTASLKWDSCEGIFGKPDLIPLWVADMDFKVPSAISDALLGLARHGVFGYTQDPLPADMLAPIAEWTQNRHRHRMDPKQVRFAPGVVSSLFSAVEAFTKPGEGVIVQPPVYTPFFNAIKQKGRTVAENPLRLTGDQYEMDFDHLESIISPSTRLLILCNPHNPGGRAWDRPTLEKLAAICDAAGVLIVSDEIHADIVFAPNTFTPMRAVSAKTLTFYAASKTFNVPGLGTSLAYSEDEELLDAFTGVLHGTGYHLPSAPGLAGTLAAFGHGGPWLDELLVYLTGNATYVRDALSTMDIPMALPQSTYLGWMDCRGLNTGGLSLPRFFVEKAGLALNSGADYGTGGQGFMRINMGCRRHILHTAMEQLERAILR